MNKYAFFKHRCFCTTKFIIRYVRLSNAHDRCEINYRLGIDNIKKYLYQFRFIYKHNEI